MFALYRKIFRPRTIPWSVALLLGCIWGLVPFLVPLLRPDGQQVFMSVVQKPYENQMIIAGAVLSAALGAVIGGVLLRIVFGKFQLLGPLLAVGVGAFVSEMLGFSNRWQTAGVVWLLLAIGTLLTFFLYIGRSSLGCHTCNGRGIVLVRDRRGHDHGYETCGTCGGSGTLSILTASVVQTLFFLFIAGACLLISYASFFKHP